MNFIGHRKCKYQKLFHDRIVNISQSHKVNIHQLSLRPLLLILLVHVAFFNLQYGLLKFSKLAFEGVEPGPRDFTIGKVVRVSRHQGCSQYQDSEAMQCAINKYIAIIFSSAKDIFFGDPDDLYYILMNMIEYLSLWVLASH